MRHSPRPIVIASRRSQLARVQAESIGRALQRRHPDVSIEFCWIESEGDQRADESLADSGGKGLFAKAVERALLDGRADAAVHSLKDMPVKQTRGLTIAAIPRRHDPCDCLVARNGEKRVEDLPGGAVFGTASPRRAAQVLRIRPDLRIALLRGNVQTRLRKVLEAIPGGTIYAATLMAVAGLERAGLAEHAHCVLDPSIMLPAAGQGALALQCRASDHVTLRRLLPLNHPSTSAAVEMERQIVAGLKGDCHSPIAALAEPVTIDDEPGFKLRARVLSPDGRHCLDAADQAAGKQLRRLAQRVLKRLKEQGAATLLKRSQPRSGASA